MGPNCTLISFCLNLLSSFSVGSVLSQLRAATFVTPPKTQYVGRRVWTAKASTVADTVVVWLETQATPSFACFPQLLRKRRLQRANSVRSFCSWGGSVTRSWQWQLNENAPRCCFCVPVFSASSASTGPVGQPPSSERGLAPCPPGSHGASLPRQHWDVVLHQRNRCVRDFFFFLVIWYLLGNTTLSERESNFVYVLGLLWF